MIAFIEGKVDTMLGSSLVVGTDGGVGYNVFATTATIENTNVGDTIKLYTYMSVSENKIALYGFSSYQETNFFELLTSVNGIGPKVALGLLNSDSSMGLAVSIVTGDVKKLQKAPGVGAKTAQRIVLELKDKIAKMANADSNAPTPTLPQGTNDAADALLALGYSATEVYQVVAKISKTTNNTEEIIKMALRELSG
ncbi:MAG: Holliday junction branch migration protein RuvA [Defluviitaleaceae bacterium]|nr:Holliday junction branch migration protein RuvA [Defluviitaleaceae bacterium]